MQHKTISPALLCAVGLQLVMATAGRATDAPKAQKTPTKDAIRWDQIGAKAGADYQGEGLSVAATQAGARLRCVFQRMDGEATGEGLWLVSTVTSQPGDRFRMTATAVGRQTLAARGTVTVTGQSVRFTRAGLVEEYSVSMDGIRQDFVVAAKPPGGGPLKVRLSVIGARLEPAVCGAQLVLAKSGRRISYSRLRASDANGKKLPARIEAEPNSEMTLVVVVNDADAVYPVRIDPTFSDANWISMGVVDGTDGTVYSVVTDGSGNLYIGGGFATASGTAAKYLAQWNGSSWSALGSGLNGGVYALAVSGPNLFAGGWFTTAGGTAANYIAQWNGHQLVGAGVGHGQLRSCAGGVGNQSVCRRAVHDGGRHFGQLHRPMERQQLVAAGVGHE
jgi:hypothetical protein